MIERFEGEMNGVPQQPYCEKCMAIDNLLLRWCVKDDCCSMRPGSCCCQSSHIICADCAEARKKRGSKLYTFAEILQTETSLSECRLLQDKEKRKTRSRSPSPLRTSPVLQRADPTWAPW